MASGFVSDNIMRWVRAFASPVLAMDSQTGSSELAVDTAAGSLKFAVGNTTKEVVDIGSTQTITANKNFSGSIVFSGATTGLRRGVTITNQAIETPWTTATPSGGVFICTRTSGTQVLTLPAAATPGLQFTFVCGAGAAAGEIQVGVVTGDNIIGKTSGADDATGLVSTVTTGLLKNTAATNVVGDFATLVSDGLTTWYMVSVAGVWSVT